MIILIPSIVGCVSPKEKDTIVIVDKVGRAKGYIRSDGAITDQVGRVKGYLK